VCGKTTSYRGFGARDDEKGKKGEGGRNDGKTMGARQPWERTTRWGETVQGEAEPEKCHKSSVRVIVGGKKIRGVLNAKVSRGDSRKNINTFRKFLMEESGETKGKVYQRGKQKSLIADGKQQRGGE